MILVVTLLDLPKLLEFFHSPFSLSVIHRNDKYYCTLVIPSLLSLLWHKGSERSVDLTQQN